MLERDWQGQRRLLRRREAKARATLDRLEAASEAPGDTKYRLDNPGCYWC